MLTGEAFNALLKTLEEPPEHVKFIFATTEVHKVPLTILSRCQRFNFKRIPTHETQAKLKEIAKQEKIKASDQALFAIAKSSEGSLRDAESLLDQLASFGDGEIKESDINFSLGLTDSDIYFSLLESLKNKDAKTVISTLAGVCDQGKDLLQFTKGLIELFRNLLVFQIMGETGNLIEGTEDQTAQLKKLKNAFSREELLFSLTLLQQLHREIRWSDTPRFLVETCLLKIANRADLKAIDEILKEVKSLRTNAPQAVAVPHKSAEFKSFIPETPSRSPVSQASQKKKENFEVKLEKTAPPEETPRGKESASANSSLALSDVGRVWPELLERVKAIKMSCGTYLAEAEPLEIVDGFVVFGLPAEFKFHKEALEKQNNKDLVRTTLATLLGQEANISFVVTELSKDTVTKKMGEAQPVALSAGVLGKESDIITSALNIFEGSKVIRRDPA